ncbi:MAG: YceI family protein [Archangium sp.]
MHFLLVMFFLGADGGVVDAGVSKPVVVDAAPKAVELKLDVDEVVFHAKTPIAGIDGTTKKMTAKREGETVRFTVPLDGVDTGIGLRNTHMKKYLAADQFPNVELVVSGALLKAGTGQKGKGTFTVKGVSKEVELTYDVKKVPSGFAVQAKFAIDITAHGVEVPAYARVTVKKDVAIETSFVVLE